MQITANPAASRVTLLDAESAPVSVFRGPALLIARVVFAAYALLAVVVLVAFNHELDRTYLTEDLPGWPRHDVMIEGLRQLNIPLDLPAWLALITIYVTAVISFAIAGVLFWKRSDQVIVHVLGAFLIGSACAIYPPYLSELAETNPLKALAGSIVTLPFPSGLLALLFLFPDGRFVPRWTRFPVFVGLAYLAILFLVFPKSNSIGSGIIDALILLTVLVSAVWAMVHRYRTAGDDLTRRQLRTAGVGLALFLAGFVAFNIALDIGLDNPAFPPRLAVILALTPVFAISSVLVWVLLAAAVLRHRLFDIELALSRTLALVGMTIAVAALYVAVVVGAAALFHVNTGGYIAVVGAAAVALAFQPIRSRSQRAANRLFYGQRSEPYSVLSELAQRLESAGTGDVLAVIVKSVTETLKLPYAAISTTDGRVAASAGEPKQTSFSAPIVHQSETIGHLDVAPWQGTALTDRDRRLLRDLALSAAAAIHAVTLRDDLLRSRERLVNAREEERRRIRRDLHDGLGPRLASLMMRIETERERTGGAVMDDLAERVGGAISDIRRLVYGLRPPALDDLGLVGALEQTAAVHNSAGGPRLTISADILPVLPAAVEVAAFRIAEEGLANAIRHSTAKSCHLTLRTNESELVVVIEDDGSGLPELLVPGVGLRSMRERAEELGGRFEIERPATGTRLRATLPFAPVVEVAP